MVFSDKPRKDKQGKQDAVKSYVRYLVTVTLSKRMYKLRFPFNARL